MAIEREDLEAGRIKFAGLASGRRRAPPHPGRHPAEFMDELGLRPAGLARALGVPVNRVTAILAGRRAISAETALRLGRFFRTSPQFWMNLQVAFDMARARRALGAALTREVTPRAA
jgi:addiction module HigA family antidote